MCRWPLGSGFTVPKSDSLLIRQGKADDKLLAACNFQMKKKNVLTLIHWTITCVYTGQYTNVSAKMRVPSIQTFIMVLTWF